MSSNACILYGRCISQTAACCATTPDEGCPIYRYFEDLIHKNYESKISAEVDNKNKDSYSNCSYQYDDINIGVQQGWQCPICKRIYSPITSMCFYCGDEQKTTTSSAKQEQCEVTHNNG